MNSGFVNRRRYVRVYYPLDCPDKIRPEIFIQYRGYQVLDICEIGVRFLVPDMDLDSEEQIAGVILFPDNSIVEISGEVVRFGRYQIALKLNKRIPKSRIDAEIHRMSLLEKQVNTPNVNLQTA